MLATRLSYATMMAERAAAAAGVRCPAVRVGPFTGIQRRGGRVVLYLDADVLGDRSSVAVLGVVGHELGHLLAGHLDRPLTSRWRRLEYRIQRTRFEIEANACAVGLVGSDALIQSYVEEINAQLEALGHERSLSRSEVLSGESRYLAAELDPLAKVAAAVPSNRAGVLADMVRDGRAGKTR